MTSASITAHFEISVPFAYVETSIRPGLTLPEFRRARPATRVALGKRFKSLLTGSRPR